MTHEAGIEAAAQEFANCWLASFDSHKIRNNEFTERIIKTYLSASGMVLLPRHPTAEMLTAAAIVATADDRYLPGKSGLHDVEWEAMLAAAPDPFNTLPTNQS